MNKMSFQFDLLPLEQQKTKIVKTSRTINIRAKRNRFELQDYDLKETLGEGGYGKVKKGIHRPTGEIVAVKIIDIRNKTIHETAEIEKEIDIQKFLLHQNIAQIYQVVKTSTKIYIIMQFCKNGELFDYINKNGPLSQKESSKFFNQILSALLYLNQNGISHRDIKLENLMFDENWNIKLIDFGLSCQNHSDELRNTYCGTASYNPPQIVQQMPYESQFVDVWCLGVTLYAMVTCQFPFTGRNQQQKKQNIINFRYSTNYFFSQKILKLFSSIFVDASKRIHLADLLKTQFSSLYKLNQSRCIYLKKQNAMFQQSILNWLQEKHHISSKMVVESIRQNKFNKYSALYYLSLKKMKKVIKNETSLSQYKRQRKESVQLSPIIHQKVNDRQNKQFNMKNSLNLQTYDLRARRRTIDLSKCRFRRNDSTNSSRRLLDCVKAYEL